MLVFKLGPGLPRPDVQTRARVPGFRDGSSSAPWGRGGREKSCDRLWNEEQEMAGKALLGCLPLSHVQVFLNTG